MGSIKALILVLSMLGFGCFAFVCSIPALILSPVFPELRFKLNPLFVKPFSVFARWLVGIKMVILHPERGDSHRPSVMIGNHQSGLDFALISQACPSGYVIVAKKELRNIPIFGWFFWIAGNLLIDRSDKTGAKAAIEQVRERLRKHDLNLAIFPEGTRSKTGEMLPFKKGAFHVAASAGFPLVPVVCSRLSGKAVWETRDLRGGNIVISILEPIETRHLKPQDLPAFMDEVRTRMIREFERVNLLAAEMDARDALV
jgi:1-acyl-sn-glycerol-3-phosphate acyltransferase